MFRGISQLNLDVKGRLAVPARHRDALARALRAAISSSPPTPTAACSSIRCPTGSRSSRSSMALSNFDPRVRELQRRLVGFADDVDMDGAGRILVPPALRDYAQLDKAVVLVGQGKKFELWNKDNWEQLMDRGGGFGAGGLPPELGGFLLVSDGSHTAVLLGTRQSNGLNVRGDGRLRRLHVRPRRPQPPDPRAARARRAGSLALDRDPEAVGRGSERSTIARFTIVHGAFGRLAELARRRRHHARATASCSISASPRRSSTTPRAASASARRAARHAHGHDAAASRPPSGSRRATESEIREVIRNYGEERFAKQIAAAIVAARARGTSPHHTTTCRARGRSRSHARATPGSGDAHVSSSTDSRQSGA